MATSTSPLASQQPELSQQALEAVETYLRTTSKHGADSAIAPLPVRTSFFTLLFGWAAS